MNLRLETVFILNQLIFYLLWLVLCNIMLCRNFRSWLRLPIIRKINNANSQTINSSLGRSLRKIEDLRLRIFLAS